jgi:hypothetical protein
VLKATSALPRPLLGGQIEQAAVSAHWKALAGGRCSASAGASRAITRWPRWCRRGCSRRGPRCFSPRCWPA